MSFGLILPTLASEDRQEFVTDDPSSEKILSATDTNPIIAYVRRKNRIKRKNRECSRQEGSDQVREHI